MNTFLDLDASQRRSAIAITAENRSITPMSIEKDYMVCSALKVLFTLPDATKYITFKGGTSLSKAYGLIERFSEDVDLVVDRELIGADPEPADLGRLSRSAKTKYVRAVSHYSTSRMLPCYLMESRYGGVELMTLPSTVTFFFWSMILCLMAQPLPTSVHR